MADKDKLWDVSIDLWRSGSVVTDFLRDEISGLKDSQGDPLSESARNFLSDLVFCRVKPRKGRAVAKSAIRDAYATRLMIEQGRAVSGTDLTPSERAIASIAKDLGMSESAISQIIHPRKSRRS